MEVRIGAMGTGRCLTCPQQQILSLVHGRSHGPFPAGCSGFAFPPSG
jgi:hypothetical protein